MPEANQSGHSNELSAAQVQSIRRELALILSSNGFAVWKRFQEFLRLIVEHALAGEFDQLRERMIGVEMFGRQVDYDTSNDAVVRVRATEVRKRLAQYYAELDGSPAVCIELPAGSYVPKFSWGSAEAIPELRPELESIAKAEKVAAQPNSSTRKLRLMAGIGSICVLALAAGFYFDRQRFLPSAAVFNRLSFCLWKIFQETPSRITSPMR